MTRQRRIKKVSLRLSQRRSNWSTKYILTVKKENNGTHSQTDGRPRAAAYVRSLNTACLSLSVARSGLFVVFMNGSPANTNPGVTWKMLNCHTSSFICVQIAYAKAILSVVIYARLRTIETNVLLTTLSLSPSLVWQMLFMLS